MLRFFEDEADTRWFWKEGYEERMYFVGAGPATHGYDGMTLWINDKLEAERSEPGK